MLLEREWKYIELAKAGEQRESTICLWARVQSCINISRASIPCQPTQAQSWAQQLDLLQPEKAQPSSLDLSDSEQQAENSWQEQGKKQAKLQRWPLTKSRGAKH